jgi:putative chitobiose transport system substrate-binding protein
MAHPFHQKTGAYAIMPSLTEGGRFFRTLLKSDIPLWGSDGRLVFADKGADKVLSFWVNLYRQGAVPSESVTAEQQSAVDRYQSGTLGLLLTGPNFLKIVKENAPQIYAVTDVAPQFPEKSHYTDYSEMLFVIPKRTAHPKEAVDFALFVTNAQNTLELSQLAPVLPPHIAALNSPEFQNPPQPDLMAKARRISAQQLLKARTPLQIHPMQNRLNQLMDFYVQSALLGRLSPEDAMTKAQEEMNRLIGVDTTP